jgi:hypothetical protein
MDRDKRREIERKDFRVNLASLSPRPAKARGSGA